MTEGNGEMSANTVFQMAYVTNDMDEALKQMTMLYGFKNALRISEATLAVGHNQTVLIEVALALAGDTQIEIIRPLGADKNLYRESLGGSGFQLVFHHEARRVSTKALFEQMKATWRTRGFSIAVEGENKFVHYCYVDTRTILGHYMEYLWYTPDEGEALLAAVRAATLSEARDIPTFSVVLDAPE